MKNANGYGSIYKLSGNRRKPWAVRKTIGYNEKNQPIYRFIGYYETREEAIYQLAIYNKNPYEITGMTLNDIIGVWQKETWGDLKSSTKTIKQVYVDHLQPMGDLVFRYITAEAWTKFISERDITEYTAKKIIGLLGEIYRYSVRYGFVGNDITPLIHIVAKKGKKTTHRAFTPEEINKVWADNNKIVLSLLYTGLRSGEYLALTPEDIKDNVIYIKDSKTKAGIRQVPIPSFIDFVLPPKTRFFVEKELEKYSHLTHDTRHTYISLLVEAGVDPRIVKKLCGHAANDITEDIYTHISIEALRKEVEKICPF